MSGVLARIVLYAGRSRRVSSVRMYAPHFIFRGFIFRGGLRSRLELASESVVSMVAAALGATTMLLLLVSLSWEGPTPRRSSPLDDDDDEEEAEDMLRERSKSRKQMIRYHRRPDCRTGWS